MDLLRTFSPDVWASVVDDWSWMDLQGKEPLWASPFGDVFFEAHDGIWWLDFLEGGLSREFADRTVLAETLESEEKQDHYLMAGLALGAERRGMLLVADQVYGFEIPPILGGATKVENIQPYPYVVYSSLTAQIHRQVKALPPGTPIHGVGLNDADGTAADVPTRTTKRRGLFGRNR